MAITKLWIHCWCPSKDEWIKKMLSIYNSAIKKNGIVSFAGK
jgi:hypothetical protein